MLQQKQKIKIVFLLLLTIVSSTIYGQEEMGQDFSLEDLMNMEVTTASKTSEGVLDAAAVITVISEQEIKTYGAINLQDVLDRVVGTNTYGSLAVPGSIYSIRGGTTVIDNLHVLVLIDGRPTRESFRNGQYTTFYQSFPVENIKRVEVIRGPGSVLYGSGAYLGVVNIITKKGAEQQNSVRARYGTGNSLQFSGAFGKKFENDVEIALGLNYVDDGGWDYAAIDEKNVPGNFEFRRKAMAANFNLNYKGFRFTAFAGQNEQNAISNKPIWLYDPRLGADSLGIWEVQTPRIFVNAGYDFKLSDKVDLTVDATYNHFTYNTSYKDVGYEKLQHGKSNGLLLEVTSFIRPTEKINIVLGASTNTQMAEFVFYNYNEDGTKRNILTNTTLPDPPFQAIPKFTTTWLAAYTNIEYSPTSFLKLVGGVQMNKVPDIKADFSPRIASIIKFTDQFAVKLMVSNAFRAPIGLQTSLVNESTLFGNPNLTPEKNTTYEGQLMYKTSRSETSLTFVNVNAKDIIIRTLPSDSVYIYPPGHPQEGEKSAIPTFINGGTLQISGVELESKISLSDQFYTNVGVSYYANEDNKGRKNLQGTPQFMFKLGVSYSSSNGISLGLFNTFAGETKSIAVFDANGDQITNDYNPSADAYSYLTGNLAFDINKLFDLNMKPRLEFSLYGTNLLDADIYYAEYARRKVNTLPGRGGRAIYATLRATF